MAHFARACEMQARGGMYSRHTPWLTSRVRARCRFAPRDGSPLYPEAHFARACEMQVEVIRAPDHFQNGWKSIIHFQRLAGGRADAVASDDSVYSVSLPRFLEVTLSPLLSFFRPLSISLASVCTDAVASGVWCPWAPKHHRQKLLIQAFKAGVATPATMCFRSFCELFQNTKTA